MAKKRISIWNPNLASKDKDFQKWYKENTWEAGEGKPYSDKLNYDFYSFYKNGDYKNPSFNKNDHFPDTYKRPSHETFSNESIYSTPENPGGQWNGEVYDPNGKFVYSYGGEINNGLDQKYNNYLNSNMKQYAQGGNLTRFDEGGTHESSPLGGIPQGTAPDGSQNMVEQGETKKGNFVYSDRISLDKDLVKQFNLPAYVANKSVSEASKAIDNKFKDRGDQYARETKSTLLDRLSKAQEFLKQREDDSAEQANQAMQANSQQVPDMMNGEVPEGMEEYSEQGQQQNPQEEVTEGQSLNPASPIAAFGGYQIKKFEGGGNREVVAPIGTNLTPAGLATLKGATLTAPQVPASAGVMPAATTESEVPGAGAYVGAASGVFDLAKTAFGKPAQDITGQAESAKVDKAGMIGGSALKGAQAGAAFGPWGAAIGGIAGGVAGLFGSKKAQAAALENSNNFAINTNRKVSDNYAAYGGILDINRLAKGGEMNPSHMITQFGSGGSKPVKRFVPQIDYYNPVTDMQKSSLENNSIKAPILTKQSTPYIPTLQDKIKLGALKVGEYARDNVGEALRYAPVAANALQLAKLKKPGAVNYQTLEGRFKPSYVDEAQMQRTVDQEANNQISALSQSGGSEGALRNAILGAGLNKTKALSDAYLNSSAQNRAMDLQAQTFNRDNDLQNLNIRNKAIDEERMDEAAYRNAKSTLLSTMGTDVGHIGKEIADADLASSLTGYTRKGKYLYKPDGSRVTPEELAKTRNIYSQKNELPVFKKGDKYTDENGVVKTFKHGGYLNINKKIK